MEEYFESNKRLWNLRTNIHKDSDFYDLGGFKSGNTSLKALEREELGPVSDKSLLHLQCHFGLDTLSLARMGASVAGIDLSDQAIDLARVLAKEEKLKADFICCNLYDLPQQLHKTFDIVFTSYGVICWLHDIRRWAEIVSKFLKPGGIFYMVEFHPAIMMFDELTGELKHSYFHNSEPITELSETTYADQSQTPGHMEYSWNHSLGDVVSALTEVGLEIEFLHEFPFSSYDCFSNLKLEKDGYYWQKERRGNIPLMFSIRAKKKTSEVSKTSDV